MYQIDLKGAEKNLVKGMKALGILSLVGILIVSINLSSACMFFRNFGESLLLAVASCCVGLLLGFLFGVPRSSQKSNSSTSNDTKVGYTPNTNLEQISDWLTKIIVGVGLVEAKKIILKINDLLNILVGLFGNEGNQNASYKAYCLVILIFFLFYGFIVGYLCTRIYLPVIFQTADKSTEERTEEIVRENIKNVTENNARARNLTEWQLTTGIQPIKVDEKELSEAIHNATADLKSEIYFKVRAFRKNYDNDKTELTKTLPVLNALIAADETEQFYTNFSQLGYANKGLANYKDAVINFTKAIEVRDKLTAPDYKIFEYNRAICNIHLDTNFNNNPKQASNSEIKDRILIDINTVQKEIGLKKLEKDNHYKPEYDMLISWLKLNDPNNWS